MVNKGKVKQFLFPKKNILNWCYINIQAYEP